VRPAAERGGELDELRTVEVEDPPRLRLVAGGDVVAGEAADVLDPVQCGSDDVGLDGEPVLVPADDLHDGFDAEQPYGDRHRDVRGVCVRRGVVGDVQRVDEGCEPLGVAAHRVETATVHSGQFG